MRIGVVGCGYWGSNHIRVLSMSSSVEQACVIDPRLERREHLSRAFPSVACFASLAEALPHLDAVVIATPPSTHTPLALQAMALGKHVLVEKPMATSVGEAVSMMSAAEQHDVVLMVGHTFEYNAAVWSLRDLIRAGSLGDVHYLDSARLNLGLYQPDVNVLWDLAPHDVSICNHLLGAVPDVVSAWGRSHGRSAYEDVAYVRLQYDELDVTAQMHVSWLDPCKVRRVTVVGSKQMAVYNDMASEEKLRIYDKGVGPADLADTAPALLAGGQMSYRYGAITSPFLPVQEPLSVQDEHFLECIRTGAQPRTDGANGLAVVTVLSAATMSLQEQRPVRLAEVQEMAAV